MSDGTWFIGSRRQYGSSGAAQPVQRLDPAEFWKPSGSGLDEAQRREYELEVLERVIAEIRDSQSTSISE
jgi:hypothetical protein